VSFQGFAIAGRGAKMRRMAGNCANLPGTILCDSRKSDSDEKTENTDIAELPAITFFVMKAFSAQKISSPDSKNFAQAVSKNRCLTPV
jgi:hypothetical protein